MNRPPREKSTGQGSPFGGGRAGGHGCNRLFSVAGRQVGAPRALAADGYQAISTALHVRPTRVACIASRTRRSCTPGLAWLGSRRDRVLRRVWEMHLHIPTKEPAIQVQVVIHHALRREVPLHMCAGSLAIQLTNLPDRRHGTITIARRDRESADAIVNQLGHRAALKGGHRCTRRHRFDHRQAEGLVELNQIQQGRRAA